MSLKSELIEHYSKSFEAGSLNKDDALKQAERLVNLIETMASDSAHPIYLHENNDSDRQYDEEIAQKTKSTQIIEN